MAIIYYARVSSNDQNLSRQLAKAQMVHANKIFTDKQSGKNTDRPGLKMMLNYIREGDIVEIASLDRLSRNYSDIKKLVQQLKNKKVRLVVDDFPISNSGNKLVDEFLLDITINLMSFVAENERQKIRERQRQGIVQARKAGTYRGRSKKYAPYSNNREGRLVFENIRRKYLTNNYTSKTQLAKENGISRQQLYRIINMINKQQK
ncbi:recombinase family protein [Limosilactobacillus sp. STM2_1]|uniref:Recombinase family protein n=1 Tax=Limosilactobacillus rudii TaxID=2759755 RepID=A0A7W3UNK4_9LACO|nr:recombinase family protein [Limosilactobacillus rudii]MBB1079270.1 recombinase family protein [Limosilactobacillus rudii]MBB1098270.1 recombinase family protein [Limosilactobacillus rudii]MCD7134340.1 recombinase family protein [Limosilactobacillus rudii]